MPPSRAPFVCASCAQSLRSHATATKPALRAFSTSLPQHQIPSPDMPRYQQTPPRMKMPFRLRPTPNQPEWRVNTKKEPLDEMYDKFVGRAGEAAKGQTGTQSTKGSDLLPEDVKWLAITHKSFDHARQGFNDRLAFLGKRIVDLQTSLALLNAPQAPSLSPSPQFSTDSRDQPFDHPSLTGLSNLSRSTKSQILSPARLAKLAQSYGLDKVVRWKPRKSGNLQASGVETVLAHTVYSIIGALALQRGGEVAARTARERILGPLGLR